MLVPCLASSSNRHCNFAYSALAAFRMGDVGVGVLPEGEEILIGRSRLDVVTLQCVSATELKACQRTQRAIHGDAAVVQELLELRRRFLALMQQ